MNGASGWQLRQRHFNASGKTYTARVIAARSGWSARPASPAALTRWYTSAGTTCGTSGYCERVVGKPTL